MEFYLNLWAEIQTWIWRARPGSLIWSTSPLNFNLQKSHKSIFLKDVFFNCVCFTKKGEKYGLRGSSCVTSREKKIRSAERILSSTRLCCCLVEETLLLLQPLLLIDIHSLIGKKFSQFLIRKTTSKLAWHLKKKLANESTNQIYRIIISKLPGFGINECLLLASFLL